MIEGTSRINALALGELTANFRAGGNITLTAKAAFLNTNAGATMGWTQGESTMWSRETIDILLQLAEAMEKDLARVHFGDGTSPVYARTDAPNAPLSLGGLGEHLGETDQI
jgi:hypothetical protein